MRTPTVRLIAGVVAAIGAINWGLVAIAEFDLVAEICGLEFGETNTVSRIIYGIVGIAGVILLVTLAIADRPTRVPEQPVSRPAADRTP